MYCIKKFYEFYKSNRRIGHNLIFMNEPVRIQIWIYIYLKIKKNPLAPCLNKTPKQSRNESLILLVIFYGRHRNTKGLSVYKNLQ